MNSRQGNSRNQQPNRYGQQPVRNDGMYRPPPQQQPPPRQGQQHPVRGQPPPPGYPPQQPQPQHRPPPNPNAYRNAPQQPYHQPVHHPSFGNQPQPMPQQGLLPQPSPPHNLAHGGRQQPPSHPQTQPRHSNPAARPVSNLQRYAAPVAYALAPPDQRALSDTFEIPDFYPLVTTETAPCPPTDEEILTPLNTCNGYYEPVVVEDEYGSLRGTFFEPESANGDLAAAKMHSKAKLLKLVNEISWMMNTRPANKTEPSLLARERKSMKPRAGMKPSFPILRPVGKTKEQFIQSLAGSDPLRLLANSVPHGYRNTQLLDALVKYRVPLLRATWYIKVVQLNNKYQTPTSKRGMTNDQINPTKDWTKTLIEYLFDHLKARAAISTLPARVSDTGTATSTSKTVGTPKGKPLGSSQTPVSTPQYQPVPLGIKNITTGGQLQKQKFLAQRNGNSNNMKSEQQMNESSAMEYREEKEEKEKGVDQEQEQDGQRREGGSGDLNAEAMKNWYAKFIYITRLIYWNYNEGLLSRKMFLDNLVEPLLTPNNLSSVEDHGFLLCLIFQYLYDVCRFKPRLKKLVTYCITTLAKLLSSVPRPVNNGSNAGFLYRSVCNVLRYAMQVAGTDIIHALDRNLLQSLPLSLDDDLDTFKALSSFSSFLSFASASTLSDLSTTIFSQMPDGLTPSLVFGPVGTSVNSDEFEEALPPSVMYTMFSKYNELLLNSRQNVNLPQVFIPANICMAAIVDVLDNFDRTGGNFEALYKHLFPFHQNAIPHSVEGDEMALNVIRMICSWAISRHRRGNKYRAFIAASVLRLYETQQRKIGPSNDVPSFQQMLVSWMSRPRLDAEHEDAVLFIGEMVRHGLFSHDNYVRYLISSGMLDPSLRIVDDMEKVLRHRRFLLEISIPAEKLHEHNQRRAVLHDLNKEKQEEDLANVVKILRHLCNYLNPNDDSASPFQWPPSSLLSQMPATLESTSMRDSTDAFDFNCNIPNESEEKLFIPFPSLSSLISSLPSISASSASSTAHDTQASELKAELLSTPRYYVAFIAEWLRICIEKAFCEDSSFAMPEEGVKSVSEILEWINDQHTLAHIVLHLFRHAPVSSANLAVTLSRKVEDALVTQNLLLKLLDTLWERAFVPLSGRETVFGLQQYLLELISKYGVLNKSVSKWISEKRQLDLAFEASVSKLQVASPKSFKRAKLGATASMETVEENPESVLQEISAWSMDLCVAKLHSWLENQKRQQPGGPQGKVALVNLVIRYFFEANKLQTRLQLPAEKGTEMDQGTNASLMDVEDSSYGNDVASLLGHLVCLLGSDVENVFIDDVHSILDNRDAIVGNTSFSDHLASIYNKGEKATSTTTPDQQNFLENVMLQESFVRFVIPAIMKSSIEMKCEFLLSIINQLSCLSASSSSNRPSENQGSLNGLSAIIPPQLSWTKQQSLLLRMKFLGMLLPIIHRHYRYPHRLRNKQLEGDSGSSSNTEGNASNNNNTSNSSSAVNKAAPNATPNPNAPTGLASSNPNATNNNSNNMMGGSKIDEKEIKQKNKKRKREDESEASGGAPNTGGMGMGGLGSSSSTGMNEGGGMAMMGGGENGQCKYEELVITLFKLFGENFVYIYDGENIFELLLDLLKAVMVGEEEYYSSRNYFNYYYSYYLNMVDRTESEIDAEGDKPMFAFGNDAPTLSANAEYDPFNSSPVGSAGNQWDGDNRGKGLRILSDDDVVAHSLQKKLKEEYRKFAKNLPALCKRQIELFLPFLEQRTSQNTISIPKNQALQSLSSSITAAGMRGEEAVQFNHIDPWTVLEDWDDCPLVPSLFGAITVQRRALTYASAFFRSSGEETLYSRRLKPGGKEKMDESAGSAGVEFVETENESNDMDVDNDNPILSFSTDNRVLQNEDDEMEDDSGMEGEPSLAGLVPIPANIVVQKVGNKLN